MVASTYKAFFAWFCPLFCEVHSGTSIVKKGFNVPAQTLRWLITPPVCCWWQSHCPLLCLLRRQRAPRHKPTFVWSLMQMYNGDGLLGRENISKLFDPHSCILFNSKFLSSFYKRQICTSTRHLCVLCLFTPTIQNNPLSRTSPWELAPSLNGAKCPCGRPELGQGCWVPPL